MPWPPACRPRTGPSVATVRAHVNITADRLPSRDVRFRSPDSDRPLAGRAQCSLGAAFRTTSAVIRYACHNRVGAVVRKSSEVLRLVDDVVDARAYPGRESRRQSPSSANHQESLGEWGVRVVLVGDPLREASRSCRALAVGGDRWLYDCVCVGVVPCIFVKRRNCWFRLSVQNRTHRLKATG